MKRALFILLFLCRASAFADDPQPGDYYAYKVQPDGTTLPRMFTPLQLGTVTAPSGGSATITADAQGRRSLNITFPTVPASPLKLLNQTFTTGAISLLGTPTTVTYIVPGATIGMGVTVNPRASTALDRGTTVQTRMYADSNSPRLLGPARREARPVKKVASDAPPRHKRIKVRVHDFLRGRTRLEGVRREGLPKVVQQFEHEMIPILCGLLRDAPPAAVNLLRLASWAYPAPEHTRPALLWHPRNSAPDSFAALRIVEQWSDIKVSCR